MVATKVIIVIVFIILSLTQKLQPLRPYETSVLNEPRTLSEQGHFGPHVGVRLCVTVGKANRDMKFHHLCTSRVPQGRDQYLTLKGRSKIIVLLEPAPLDYVVALVPLSLQFP